jgi:hypothetical protein
MTGPRDSTDTTFRSGPTFGQWLGGFLIVTNVGLLFVDAIVLRQPAGKLDVILHLGALVAAMYFIYPNKFQAIVSSLKDKLPTFGGSA